MAEIEDYSATDASNIDPAKGGWKEEMDRDTINDQARKNLGATRRDWESGVWRNPVKDFTVTFVSSTSVSIAGTDATAFFPTNRKVKIVAATGNPVYAFVTSSTFGGGNTTVNVDTFDDGAPDDAVRSDANGISFYSAFGGTAEHGIGRNAFEDSSGAIEPPPPFTAAGINAAIVSAVANGRIVVLQNGTYTLETQVEIIDGTRLWGVGPGRTILKAANNLDGPCLLFDAAASSIELRSFEVDGNATNQTPGSYALCSGIEAIDDHDSVVFADLHVHDTAAEGIVFTGNTNPNQSVNFTNVVVNDTGDHGIELQDNGFTVAASLENVRVFDYGSGGVASTTADGIRAKGIVNMSNIQVSTSAGATHVGAAINMLQTDATATPSQGAHLSTLSNFSIDVTGSATVGLLIGGVDNRISNGTITGSGTSCKPINVDGRGGGVERAVGNGFSNVLVIGGLECQVQSDAVGTQFSGCEFKDQSSTGIIIYGDDTQLSGCIFSNQDTGVNFSADNGIVEGSRFWNHTIAGVRIGGDENRVKSCEFDGQLIDAVLVASGDGNEVTNNTYRNQSGDLVDDSGTNTDIGSPVTFISGVTQNNFGVSRVALTNMEGVPFPRPPNGSRRFTIAAIVGVALDSTPTISVQIHIGTSGDITDTPVSTYAQSFSSTPSDAQMTMFEFVTAPAVNELVTVSVLETGGAGGSDILANGATPITLQNVSTLDYLATLSQTWLKITYESEE
jgi:hypothetical protein